ncbi:Ldh family oxidoreductase [Nitratireductor pacificus]|uniref:Malate/L-lactate dehydrogenase n=1 Tax=Nitratireductor pacificus pht-3B TaxID=391937 RepID=K2LLF6_9HYPH|nr:Ldh family oxidoreductase [Nitratireductor pacificus]EKF18599.1 malate/L-lactate dehydrogenase [Nitratireductor pacificus pht-3B]
MTRLLSADEITALVTETLIRCRTSRENAQAVARALLGAELAGQAGHGLRRMPSYCAQALSGKVDGMAAARSRETRPAALSVDAAHGFAYPALELALAWLPAAARRNGIAMAGIHRSHHCGVAGLVVEQLAEDGLVGLLFANTPGAMAPWGGRHALFGTDPIAFAAPLDGADPVVVDISLSKVARGKIMAASQQGRDIPEGWALDANGNPTTDAKEALKGTMVPMGDAKGTALAIMVELLCAGLTGANYGYEASSFFDGEGAAPGTGQLVIAIDPTAFGDGALDRFAVLAGAIDGMDGARLPGRRRQALKARLLAEGVPCDDALLREIEALGR